MTTRQDQSATSAKLAHFLGSSRFVLEALSMYGEIPVDRNPVWEALAGLTPVTAADVALLVEAGEMSPDEGADFLRTAQRGAELGELLAPLVWKGKTPRKSAILRAYALCQTACLNSSDGPIGTGDLGTIRQRWYFSKNPDAMGFKFAAQALERYLIRSADVVLVDDQRAFERARRRGARRVEFKNQWRKGQEAALQEELGRGVRVHVWPKVGWGRSYAQLQSQILATLVRDGLTYEELWVRDASRNVARSGSLVRGFYGVLVLEKEGLFEHFEGFCRAAGIPVLVSMSGSNAFSSVEAVLNDSFRSWVGQHKPSPDNPLHLFCISDHDYYGIVPVQFGAVAQFDRYLPGCVVVHRVGISPEQLEREGRSASQAGYEFDYEYNQATRLWADEEGVWVGDVCYGIEVEALEPVLYIEDLVDQIVEALGGDEAMRDRLLAMARPDWYTVQRGVAEEAKRRSELMRRLQALSEWVSGREYEIEDKVQSWVEEAIGQDDDGASWAAQPAVADTIGREVEGQRDQVGVEAYKEHVRSGWGGAWRPVDGTRANQAVVDLFVGAHEHVLDDLAQGVDDTVLLGDLQTVFEILASYGLEFDA